MTIINTMMNSEMSDAGPGNDAVMDISDIIATKGIEPGFGFQIMYEQWKQKILLSNGVDDDENLSW